MAKELNVLSDLVFNHCTQPNPKPWSAADFNALREEAEKGILQLRKQMLLRLYSITTAKEVQIYIRQMHTTLILLMDTLYNTCAEAISPSITHGEHNLPAIAPLPQKLPPTRRSLAIVVHHQLFTLLADIRRYLPQTDRLPVALPQCMLPVIRRELSARLHTLQTLFQATPADSAIISAVGQTLTGMIDEGARGLTFYQSNYLSIIIPRLTATVGHQPDTYTTGDLISALAEVNLNTDTVTAACRQWLHNLAGSESDTGIEPHQPHHLHKILRQLKQVQPLRRYIASKGQPGLRQELITWITGEQAWQNMPHPVGEPQRIETTLSVSQIALLVRLMTEEGIFPKSNQVAMMRLFSRYFSTPNAKNISSDSMRTRYYNIERATCVSVRDLLFNLIKRSHTFPH